MRGKRSTWTADRVSRPPTRVGGRPLGLVAPWLLLAGLVSAMPAAAAQVEARTDTVRDTLPDSVAPVDRAREAQRRFEQIRRRFMPPDYGSRGEECDARVGRVCWYHQTQSWWRSEREVPIVEESRDSLIIQLADIARAVPEDEWLVGQRVWYLMEAERAREGLALARRCAERSWWCSALEGLSLHVEGRYPEAEEAFERALRTMDADSARRWEDVAGLLDREGERTLAESTRRSPEEREATLRLLWRLADPLQLVPGNDRRTEHLARRTVLRIRSQAADPYGMPWGDDIAEVILRYGWEGSWERALPGTSRILVGHDHADSRGFLPPGPILADPVAVQPEPWAPALVFSPAAYAPPYAPVLLPMQSRFVVLTRGDSSLVAATFDLPADTTSLTRYGHWRQHRPPPALEGAPLQAALFVSDAEGVEVRSVRERGSARGVLHLFVPAGSYRVSAEVLDPAVWRAGRLGNGIAAPHVPPDVATLSELLLLEDGPLPADTHEALRRLRASDVFTAGEPIVVAWELWGLGWRPETLRYRLVVREDRGGVLRALGGLFGLGGGADAVLEWEEPGPERPGAALRSASMELPALEPGDYVVRLEMTAPGRGTLVSEQRVRIVAPDEPGGA